MLLPLDSLDNVYKQIKEQYAGGKSSILIFVAATLDGIAASRQMTKLLSGDFIRYTLRPVEGYEDIQKAGQELLSSEDGEFQTILLIDCGGTVDVFELLKITESHTVLILDSHRPYHLANIYAENVFLVLGGPEDEDYPTVEVIDAARLDEEDEDEAEDNDDEEESRRGDVDDDDSASESPSKRARSEGGNSDAGGEPRLTKKSCRRAIRSYYRGTFFSTTAASLVYTLSTQLRKDNNDLLWLAIVSLTDQYIHDRIDRDRYMLEVQLLQDQVMRHNIDLEDNTGELSMDSSSSRRSLDGMRIVFADSEYRFMLMRHWNLYDAMYYSSYVASRISVYGEKGRQALQQYLARMGLPLGECRQRFSHMSGTVKQALDDNIQKFAPEIGLHDIVYSTFSKERGFRFHVTAADVVHSIYGLLEGREATDTTYMRNFYAAFDALTDNESVKFNEGIEKAKKMQELIVRKATQLLDRKLISSMPSFRYSIFDASGDDEAFLNPLMLSKLALFLMEVDRQHGSGGGKPMVLGSSTVTSNTYLLVGVTGPSRSGIIQKNKFGECFNDVAVSMDADVRFKGFDTSVMEISRQDVSDFWVELQLQMTQ